jgi:histidinol phosphatase-like enzyme (inositol monophosphatase family)
MKEDEASKVDDRLRWAIDIARRAGEVALRYFRSDSLPVEQKTDGSPVTRADREAELALREWVRERFPADSFLGEEFGEWTGDSPFRWIVDPIDGTRSFIHGVPLFATLIGVEREREPLVGVIRVPALDECVYAAKGQGAWLQVGQRAPHPARVSAVTRLDEAAFVTTAIESFEKKARWDALVGLCRACKATRTWGDAYGYLLVATGRAEIMLDPFMNVWDAAAILPVMEEAGGSFTNWSGRVTIYGGEGLAVNKILLPEVLRFTQPPQAD